VKVLEKPAIPAAQYLRMSTDDQQYSIANQRLRIQEYAEQYGFKIIQTYEDPGRTGVVVGKRKALRALLKDVVSGEAKFKAILVYDVSRWGRFQNPDEAAHYEFLCTTSGTPLHYCAEHFNNDGTASSSIIKALKRSMAAEFSRELGEKVFRGKVRLTSMGFWMGGPAGYGYRRRIVSADGRVKQILKAGQQKALKTDRITLVLGPCKEVESVRLMFSMAAAGKNCTEIVRALNRKDILIYGNEWNDVTTLHILTNPKYMGTAVWNRHTQRLHSPLRLVDPQFWIAKPGSFPAIVSQQTFDRAQTTIQKMRDSHWSADRVLKAARRLLKLKGKLTSRMIEGARGLPSTGTIRNYFGTYRNLYKALDYVPEKENHVYRIEQALRSAGVRKALGEKLAKLFPNNIRVFHSRRGARSILNVDDTFPVSILFCRSERIPKKPGTQARTTRGLGLLFKPSWAATPAPAERDYITLLCLLHRGFHRILDFYVVEKMGERSFIRLRRGGGFLRKATRLTHLSNLYTVVTRLWKRKNENPEELNPLTGY
jgi:DNA invertase Pin-like site-specific DNA recombinase